MKIGLQLYLGGESASPDFLDRAVPAIEACGFHEIWLAEHILLFPEIKSRYPYSEDGSFPYDTTLLPLEPFTAMAFIAARTKTIRLATGVSVLPQRNPVFAAKQVADVDVLSRGRVDYGIGTGWCLEEIEGLGVDSARRGARTDDYIQLMKKIWTETVIEHDGPFHSVPPSHSGPKPVQKPHPPIYIGGISAPALRRVARLGDGWFSVGLDPQAFGAAVAKLADLVTAAGRSPESVSLAVSPIGGKADLDQIKAYQDAGADQVVLALAGRDIDRFLARLEGLAEHVVAPAASF
jgi:probable F420-dependent oxidoreductase